MTSHTYDIIIDAPRPAVWKALTDPASMREWMGEPQMELAVEVDWAVGAPIRISGVHHEPFVNTGTVMRFDPERSLAYSHRSSASRLPDVPESYSAIGFELSKVGTLRGIGTMVMVTVSGFPTVEIERHLDFYWRGTLVVLKRYVEERRERR